MARIRCRAHCLGGERRRQGVVAPLSLGHGFAAVSDGGADATPRLRTGGETELLLIDLGGGRNRLGGSTLAQVYSRFGNQAPDADSVPALKNFFQAIQELSKEKLLLAYHDRSDGGLFATVCEMAFAGRCGVTINLDMLVFDQGDDLDGSSARTRAARGARPRLPRGRRVRRELGRCCRSARPPHPGDGPARSFALETILSSVTHPRDERVHAQCRRVSRKRRNLHARGPNQLPHAAAARQTGVRAGGIRPRARFERSGPSFQ